MIQDPARSGFRRFAIHLLRSRPLSRLAGLGLGGLLVAIAIVGCSGGPSTASPTSSPTPRLSDQLRSSATPTCTPTPTPPPGLRSNDSTATATVPAGDRSPEAIVEGAIRSGAQALVAPPEYRSGRLSQCLGDAWIARVESDYRQWYASPTLDDMIEGIHNVVGASETGSYPIVVSVDGLSTDVPSASVDGDEATIERATFSYVIHRAPGIWQPDEPYSAECDYTLRRTPDGWRVTDAACSDSGG